MFIIYLHKKILVYLSNQSITDIFNLRIIIHFIKIQTLGVRNISTAVNLSLIYQTRCSAVIFL